MPEKCLAAAIGIVSGIVIILIKGYRRDFRHSCVRLVFVVAIHGFRKLQAIQGKTKGKPKEKKR
jgi:hypothetical protein